MIHIKNTLSGKLEKFKPINPPHVGMYNCGPTVYGKVHIGNMRAYVFADLIKNVLRYNGYDVKQVINITDVGHLIGDGDEGEDKMEQQAKKESLNVSAITKKYTDYFYQKLDELNIDRTTVRFPKASDNIPEQIAIIKTLEEKGFTYSTSDGVYFDTSKFPKYGELGHIDIRGLQEGARIQKNDEKRNVTDFALWKFSGKIKRLQEWESPWGKGFPGWHIECSAMAEKYLGKTFDIHTGGIDHIPTHHQNEIAQSESAFDVPLANYWLHVNHITIDGEKISKSLGNTVYVEDLEAKGVSPMAYKYWLYTSHYSTLSNFTIDAVKAVQKARNKLVDFVTSQVETGTADSHYKEKFVSFVNNDLDTPKAIALMFDLLKDQTVSDADKKATILDFDQVLKLDLATKEAAAQIPNELIVLADRRLEAKTNKDFALADALREKIESLGYVIKDTPAGSYVLEQK